MEQIKQKSIDAPRAARMDLRNSMDEESKNKLRNEKYMEYMRKNKAQWTSYSPPQPQKRWTKIRLPLNTSHFPSSNQKMHTNDL